MKGRDKHSGKLYGLCERFVRESIKTLKRSISYPEPQVPGEEYWNMIALQNLLRHWNGKEIRNLPSLTECVEFLSKDHSLRATRDSSFLFDQLVKFFKEFVSQNLRVEFDRGNFDALYSDFESYLYSEEDEYTVFAPLDNFQCSLQKVDIDCSARIRKLSEEEKSDIRRHEFFRATSLLAPLLRVGSFEFTLEGICRIRKGDVIDFSQSIERFREIIYVLRLCKRGDVGCSTVRINPKRWCDYGKDLSVEQPVVPLVGRPSIPYHLAEDDVKKFKGLWHLYQRYLKHRRNFIELAFRRLNYAYERERAEDKLVDLMIAFEALYSKKGDTLGEHTHKLSVRTACFLEQDYDRRKELRDAMRKAYHIGSSIRHGQKENVDRQLLLETEDRLRLSIEKFMATNAKHDEIVSKLDLQKNTN